MFGKKKEDEQTKDEKEPELATDSETKKKKKKRREEADQDLPQDVGPEEEGEKRKKKKKHKAKSEDDREDKDKGEPRKQSVVAPSSTSPYQIVEPDRRSESIFEDDDKFGDSFKDSAIRSKFIRKVYLILSIQLGFTTCFNIPFLYLDDVQEFIYDYPWIVFIALAVFVVPYFMLVCCESTRRSFPTNIILLFLMTLGMAGVCGYMTAKLDTEVVFYAFLLTVVVTLSITTLAIFCPFDFTRCLMVMCVVIIVLIVFAMIAVVVIIITKSKIVNLVYAGICVVLFSLFLMFDTQAIIGGRRVRLNPEEYILAAIQIYVDIVEIFLNFLELIGACTEND